MAKTKYSYRKTDNSTGNIISSYKNSRLCKLKFITGIEKKIKMQLILFLYFFAMAWCLEYKVKTTL